MVRNLYIHLYFNLKFMLKKKKKVNGFVSCLPETIFPYVHVYVKNNFILDELLMAHHFKILILKLYSFIRILQSGSDVITPATYQASIEGFAKHLGLQPEEEQQQMMSGIQLGKEIEREFLSHIFLSEDRREPLVAGSVGPYGAFLHDRSEYTGAYEDRMAVEELKDWHRPDSVFSKGWN
ncbi:uncharacterized protein LOC127448768 [Myxocyprinus asiaticus]|uniref:uncharacterized protein LOC127448768 n=1 Tax=Myxocyprinus asiaticus TaxID=70543 RepID=UPI0022226188|nr:uncharacterized protein LOC127448768 [Myxocyprinus asiaticus]